MIPELINDFTSLPPGIQVWALKQVGTWTAAAAEKLGVAVWQKGKATLQKDPLSRAFQTGLADFMAQFPARDDADYDVLRQSFEQDAIIADQAAKLLRLEDDPIDLDRIETSLRAAGLEPDTLPDFDLGQALRRFFLAFLNAANDEQELRAKFQTALQYRVAQASPIRFKHDRPVIARYNQHVADRYGRLTLYSLTADAPLRVELERVYVQLTTVERVRRQEPRLEQANRTPEEELRAFFGPSKAEANDFAGSDEFIKRVLNSVEEAKRQTDARPRVKRETSVERILSAREALAGATRLVIVGAPGSGKTTLLQWIALTFACDAAQERLGVAERRVPIFVPLRTLGKYIATRPEHFQPTPACLLDFLQIHFAAWQLDLPDGFFAGLAAEARCAFLFDGLDEVADPGRRSDVSRAVQAFVARYPGNRYTITSRPAGYTGLAHFGSDFQRCDVRPFSDDDVEQFTTNWYLAVETAVEDNPATRQKGNENAADLLQRIRENDRIRRLVSTPLLLTVVALVHQNRTTLPHRRAELYDECTQMLLGFWDEQKGGEAARELAQLGELDRHDKRAILEPIALRIHEQGQAHEVEGHDLRQWLREEFAAIGDPHPDKRAKLFLRVIQERAGLLVESDTDTYRFSHLTFQEYLAARAIADRDDYVEYTLARRHDPWWREVILLEAGHLSTPRSKRARRLTTALIEAIWQTEDKDPLEREIDQILRRNLLLAGRCLADLGTIGVDDMVRDNLIAELSQTLRATPYTKLREEAARVLAGLGERGAAALISTLATDEWYIRQVAASSLGQLGQTTPNVVQALLSTLADDEWRVRQAAASSLGQLGQATPNVVQALISALADADDDVREAVASSLGQLATADFGRAAPNVVHPLISALADDDDDVREAAASSLGQLGQATPNVVQALISALTDNDSNVQDAAAASLGQLGQASPTVITALLSVINNDNWSVRKAAVASLGQLGQISPDVVTALLSASTDDEWLVQEAAAASLDQLSMTTLGHTSPAVVTTLISALTDNDWYIQQAAAASLGQLGQTSPAVVTALLTALYDNEHPVFEAASSLSKLGQASSAVVTALISALDNVNSIIRQQAASSLGQLEQASPTVVQALTLALDDDILAVRQTAAASLIQLGQASPDVATALISILASTDDIWYRYQAAAAANLGQLGQVSPAVITTLLAALYDDEQGVRRAVAVSLGQLGQASPDVVQALIPALADDHSAVRHAAASSLGQLGQVSPDVVQALISALANDNSAVRRAAASSLVQLGRDDREMVVKALLPVFSDPAFEKPARYNSLPAYDHAFDALWAIAGGAASLQEE